MKTCNNCGAQNNDESAFCEQCGASLSVNADVQQQYADYAAQQYTQQNADYAAQQYTQQNADYAAQQYTQQNAGYAAQQYTQPGSTGYAASTYAQPQTSAPYPLLQTLKNRGGGALFLVAVICTTLQLLVNLYEAFAGNSGALQYLYYAIGYSSYIKVVSVFLSLIGMIPSILMVIGLWLIFANCKKSGSAPLSTTGFSMVRGVLIFSLVCWCILFSIMLIGGTISAVAGMNYVSYYASSSYGTAYLIGFFFGFLIVVGLMVLVILYFVKAMGSAKSGKQIVLTGTASKNISAYVGVMQILMGVCTILFGLIGQIVEQVLYESIGYSALVLDAVLGSTLPAILSGVTSLLFGILIMSVRSEFALGMAQQSQQYTGMQ